MQRTCHRTKQGVRDVAGKNKKEMFQKNIPGKSVKLFYINPVCRHAGIKSSKK